MVLEKLRSLLFPIARHRRTTRGADCFHLENGGLRDDNSMGSVIREGFIVPVESRELSTYKILFSGREIFVRGIISQRLEMRTAPFPLDLLHVK